jgi:pimeloyl-ACP methyl ester carboxylesterase
VALLLAETWTGTGSWPTGNWTSTYTGAGASSSIVSDRGRLTVPTADAVIEWADDVVLPTDYDIRGRVTFTASGDYDGRVYFGTEFSTGGFSGNGHYVWVNPGDDTLGIGTVVGYATSTPVGSTTFAFSNIDTVYVHIKVRGSVCWVRAWKNAEDEPLSWQLTGTLTYTFDELHLGAEGLGGSGSVDFDDLVVYSNKMVTKTIDTGWAGSGDLIILSHASPTWTGVVKAIVWKHGGVGGSAEEVDDYDLWPEVISDSNGRYVLYAADDGFGGNGAAGNDTELGSLDAVFARAQTDEPDFPRVALGAHSLGGMGIVNWADRNDTDVAGMVGVDVILDAAQQNTNDGGTFVTNVLDPAYGGTGTWATNASTRDPEDLATASAALRAIPFQIFDATGDATLNSNVMSNYVTAHGANATRTTVASGDHSTVHNFVSETDVITFLEGLSFAAPSAPPPSPSWSYRSTVLRR